MVTGLQATIVLRILVTNLVDVLCVVRLGCADSQGVLRAQNNTRRCS